MRIALIGAEINNDNLGCQALTWTMLQMLDKITRDNGIKATYYVLESHPSKQAKLHMASVIGMDPTQIVTVHRGNRVNFIHAMRHVFNNFHCKKIIDICDIVIDLTEGDSFSDIYGTKVFDMFFYYIRYAIKKNIPLILGPQTYGPFRLDDNKKKAKFVFDNADVIMARDAESAKCVSIIAGKNAFISNDLAFNLKYNNKSNMVNHTKKYVGLNISGLLATHKVNEYNKNLELTDKYNQLIERIITYLLENYEVYLIPHVMEDVDANLKIHKKFPTTHIYGMFDDPIQAKTEIAKMDIFIGSRMHATIAAISSGVVTIPIAYSRKFEGVFDLIDYHHTINLYENTIDDAYSMVIACLSNYEEMVSDVNKAKIKSEIMNNETYKLFDNVILQHLNSLDNFRSFQDKC
jgi:polysaccharide pyruvyl transferase WcaK-like protein